MQLAMWINDNGTKQVCYRTKTANGEWFWVNADFADKQPEGPEVYVAKMLAICNRGLRIV